MNFKGHLFLCLFLLSAFCSSAQSWVESDLIYTNTNVGIGFATKPVLSDRLVVNGNIKIENAGMILHERTINDDTESNYLIIQGQDVKTSFGGYISANSLKL